MEGEQKGKTSGGLVCGSAVGLYYPVRRGIGEEAVIDPCDLLFSRSSGFVVGHAGLLQALAMLLVAYIILALTVLSVCAIATNGAVRGGGAYCILPHR